MNKGTARNDTRTLLRIQQYRTMNKELAGLYELQGNYSWVRHFEDSLKIPFSLPWTFLLQYLSLLSQHRIFQHATTCSVFHIPDTRRLSDLHSILTSKSRSCNVCTITIYKIRCQGCQWELVDDRKISYQCASNPFSCRSRNDVVVYSYGLYPTCENLTKRNLQARR